MRSPFSHRFAVFLTLLVLPLAAACNDPSAALLASQAELEQDHRKLEERIASLEKKLDAATARLEVLSRSAHGAAGSRLPSATLTCPAGWRALGPNGQLLAGCEGPVQDSGFAINCNVAASAADDAKTAQQYFDEAFNASPQLQHAK